MSAQNPPRRGVLGAILGTVAFSALAGLLVTATVTPGLVVTSVAIKSGISIFDSLPSYLEIGTLPQQNKIFANQGKTKVQIATVFSQNRQEVSWDEVSANAKNAAIAGEDRRFYQHGAIDPTGIVRALVTNAAQGGVSQGASTITQQLVKNIFVSQAESLPTVAAQQAAYKLATSTTVDRKLKEMKLAIGLEKKYTKDQILLAYLNIANFGNNTYGIQAAAEQYYHTTALKLTAAQAASLIAIVQNPSYRSLGTPANYAANKQRRDEILGWMADDGKLTPAELQAALATPVDKTTVHLSLPSNGCVAANQYAKWFCDYVTKLVPTLTTLGQTPAARLAAWQKGGYNFYTTLDLGQQTTAQKISWKYAPNNFKGAHLGSATVSVQAGTGRILTMAENKYFNDTGKGGGYNSTAVNFNTDQAYGGSVGFQTGSTYKAFTLIDWLDQGNGLNQIVNGSARTVNQNTFTDTCPDASLGGVYQFRNDTTNESGPMTVRSATANSVNGAFVSMAQQLDLCDIRNVAMSLGVHTAAPFKHQGDGEVSTNPATNASSVLGTNTIAPLTMAAAYAGIADGGTYCAPIAIDSIVDATGATLPGQAKACKKVIDSGVDAAAISALEGVLTFGTGGASNPNDGTQHFAKTGTTNDSVHTWTVGASSRVATAVWVGNYFGQTPMRSFYVNGIQAAQIRHQIWRRTMTSIDHAYPAPNFPAPPSSLLVGNGVALPNLQGQSISAATAVLAGLGFKAVVQPAIDSVQPAGTVAKTDPAAGSVLSKGYQVNLFPSNGSQKLLPNVKGMTQPNAHSALNNAGFTNITDACVVVTDPTQVGVVQSQSPGPLSGRAPNTQITINLGKLSCP